MFKLRTARSAGVSQMKRPESLNKSNFRKYGAESKGKGSKDRKRLQN